MISVSDSWSREKRLIEPGFQYWDLLRIFPSNDQGNSLQISSPKSLYRNEEKIRSLLNPHP